MKKIHLKTSQNSLHNDVQISQLTQFDCEKHDFGPNLTVSRSSSIITLISHGQLKAQYFITELGLINTGIN